MFAQAIRFLSIVAMLGWSCSGPGTLLRQDSETGAATQVVFEHATVLTMTSDEVLEDHTVFVSGDRITALVPSREADIPEGTLRVDASGKYLMPGFAELHGHIPPPTAPPQYVEDVLFLYVANGVTTVRGMLGAPNQLELRGQANRGEILSPTLYLAGPSFSGNSIDSPQAAERLVHEQKAAGWDLLKVHPGLTREEYEAMARTAGEVGIPFAGHVPAEVGLVLALELGQQTIDHLDGYIEYLGGDQGPVPDEQLAEAVRLTREAGAWVIPTMALWETIIGSAELNTLSGYPELRYMPAQDVQGWIAGYNRRVGAPDFDRQRVEQIASNRIRLLKALNEGGVKILFGTDAPQIFSVPGFSIHRELPFMVAAEMTPYQILLSGTRSVGEYFKDKDQFGTVETGSRADLILLQANPLEDVGNLSRRAGVMVRGRWLPESEIQQRLEEIAARND